jgi:hypothetical protein
MKFHYKKSMSILCPVFGAVFIPYYFFRAINGGETLAYMMIAFVLILYGFRNFTKSFAILHGNSIEIFALIGKTKQTYQFNTFTDFEIQKNKIFILQNGSRVKLPLTKRMTDSQDWKILIKSINT